MAGIVCKAAINSLIIALMEALERILTDPDIHGNKVPESARNRMIQEMADLDLATYRGLSKILLTLQDDYGVVSDDVWVILNKPDEVTLNKPDEITHSQGG